MSRKSSSNIDSFTLSIVEESSIINLISYDYDSSEEIDDVNLSQNSIDSSEFLDDLDDEVWNSEIYKLNKRLVKKSEANSEIISV